MKMTHLLLTLLAVNLLAQTSDPVRLGPLEVNGAGYRLDNVHVRGIPYATDIWGSVFYPRGLAGGPYPLIILLHGNHGICRQPGTKLDFVTFLPPPACTPGFTQTPNHEGYDYLAGHLASHGYIVASISANAINGRATAISERGRLVQEHLRFWEKWNSAGGGYPFGTTFAGKIDFTRVGLWGHSRGGEGVRAAYEFNRQERRPFGIKAVMEFGPVDFGRANAVNANPLFNVDNVAFSVVLPVCDRDVSSNEGMRAYDRAFRLPEAQNPSAKSQLYFWGANHNFTNVEWEPEDALLRCIDYPVITTREEQMEISKIYTMAFFRMYLGGENFKALFSGDAPPPPEVRTPVHLSYADPDRLVVDDFSRPRPTMPETPRTNLLEGATTFRNATGTVCAGNACNTLLPGDWFHDAGVSVARVTWENSPEAAVRMEMGIDATPRDVSRYSHVAFRAAVRFDSANPYGQNSQAYAVRLIDVENKSVLLRPTSETQSLPFPTGSLFRRAVLKTVRLPLAGATGVDLTKLSRVEIVFNGQAGGSVYLTEVQFTR